MSKQQWDTHLRNEIMDKASLTSRSNDRILLFRTHFSLENYTPLYLKKKIHWCSLSIIIFHVWFLLRSYRNLFNNISYDVCQHDLLVSAIDWSEVSDRIVSCSHDRNSFVWTYDAASNVWKPALVILRIDRAATDVKWYVCMQLLICM